MQLIGNGVESRITNGDLGLKNILDSFTDVRCKELCKSKFTLKRKAIEKTLEEITSTIAPPFQEAENKKNRSKLVSDYICSAFGLRYDLLSKDLFSLKRVESIKIENKSYKVELPLFAYSPLSSVEGAWKHEHVTPEEGTTGKKFEYKIDISAKAPNIPSKVLQEVCKARGYYYSILADALKKPILGELLSNYIESANCCLSGERTFFATDVYWIPRPEDLKIESTWIDKDPFVAAQLHGKFYLIPKNWDIKEELPYQHYLDEFTEKKAIQDWHKTVENLGK